MSTKQTVERLSVMMQYAEEGNALPTILCCEAQYAATVTLGDMGIQWAVAPDWYRWSRATADDPMKLLRTIG